MIKHEIVSSDKETSENEKTLKWKMEVNSLGILIIKVKSPGYTTWQHLIVVGKEGDFNVSECLLNRFNIKLPIVM